MYIIIYTDLFKLPFMYINFNLSAFYRPAIYLYIIFYLNFYLYIFNLLSFNFIYHLCISHLYLFKLLCIKLYINLACLFDCLSVCLFKSNKRQTAEPIEPKFFVGHLGTQGKVYE